MNLENKSNIVIEDGNGFMRLFSAEPTETVAKKLLMEYGEIEGFKVVLDEILDLQNSEVYQKLVILDNPIDSSVNLKYAIKNDQYTDLQRLANKYLSAFPLRLPLTPVINIKDFAVTYTFIGYLYSIRTGCRIYQEDLQKIEQGVMVTRIVLLLDKFNKPEKTPKTTPEFFKMLNKLKWHDRRTKRFLNDISNLYFTLSFNKWGGEEMLVGIFQQQKTHSYSFFLVVVQLMGVEIGLVLMM
jgi:hypothetical protein